MQRLPWNALTVALAATAAVAGARPARAIETSQDERYVYYRTSWAEMHDDRQRELVREFGLRVVQRLDDLHVPHSWSTSADDLLTADEPRFQDILEQTRIRGERFAYEQNVRANDFIPTGFIFGVGINGSGNLAVGVGGSALLTITAVPFEVTRIDKITRAVKTCYEVGWALGGFAQVGAGIGGGGGAAARGAFGLIWGPLPQASALTGWALGVAADVRQVAGLAVKAAIVHNSTIGRSNLVAMTAFDLGPQAGGELHGTLFYFASAEQVMRFAGATGASTTGHDEIEASTPDSGAVPAASSGVDAGAARDPDAGEAADASAGDR